MITEERIKKAEHKLIMEAKQIATHATLLQKFMESDFLDKQDGKIANARLLVPMARAMGCEESEYQGKPWFPNASFAFGYLPAPLHNGRKDNPQLKMHVCSGWGDFEVPLICEYRNGYRIDGTATRAAWAKIIELRRSWAADQERAASKLKKAAAGYNKIEKEAVSLLESLGCDKIHTLRAFGGDIYDRLNPFRWHEQKAEVEYD